MKKNHKRIFLLLIVLTMVVASCSMFNSVEAATTAGNGEIITSNGFLEEAFSFVTDVIGYIGGMVMSGVGSFITPLINLLSVIMFVLLEAIFKVGTGSWASPMPDSIVFNRVPFLDANFINPHSGSLLTEMGISIFKDLFASFQAIAIALFVIAAMITGLKLALSTIASKKAQYKEVAMKWITGFAILLCLRWILAGIFYINEFLVAELYKITIGSAELKIPIYLQDAIPVIGRLLTDITKSIAKLWGGDGTLIYGTGYYGIIAANLTKAIGGDIVASITTFVIIGQAFTLIGAYFKRMFMALLLGIVSPLIVAADTVVSVQGGQSTIFKNWFKNFTLIVFTQAFHAMYMVVVLQILANIYREAWTAYMLQPIVAIILTTGLVKMEKLIKGMFGIGDSLAGDLKDGSKGLKKVMQAGAGLMAAGKALADNVPKMNEAAKRKQAYTKELNAVKNDKQNANDRYKEAMSAARDAKHKGDTAEYAKQMKIAMEARRESVYGPGGKDSKNANNSSDNSSNNNSKNKGNGDYLQQVVNKYNDPSTMTTGQTIQRLEEGVATETANYKSALLATVMGTANLAAGIGIGLGTGDDISETLFQGGMVTALLDKGAEGIGRRAADKDRKTFYEYEKKDGEKMGYTPSEKIIREKTVVESAVTFDVAKLNKELQKQFKGLGEVFGDTLKKELREVDRDLDNE